MPKFKNIDGCLSLVDFCSLEWILLLVFANSGKYSRSCASVGRTVFYQNAKTRIKMKTESTGTNYVPSFRTQADTNTLMERYFRSLSDCEVKTSSDAYYVSEEVLTFICPPCVIAFIYCIIKAKKGVKQ